MSDEYWLRPTHILESQDDLIDIIYWNSAAALRLGKNASLRTLLVEVAELAAALDGKHEHPPELELVQIAGICLTWLRRMRRDLNA